MYYALLILLMGAGYYYFKKRLSKKPYQPGALRHAMDPVSSSMLLSEVDPAKFAQCCIVTLLVFETRVKYEDFVERFVENVIATDPDSRFLYRVDHVAGEWRRMNSEWDPRNNCREIRALHTLETAHELVASRLRAPLDVRKPVWELAFIDRFEHGVDTRSVSAVMLTLHHSMGDGFTLCHQMMRRSASSRPGYSMHQCYPFEAPRIEIKRRISLLKAIRTISSVCKSVVKLLLMAPDPVSALRGKCPRVLQDELVVGMAFVPFSVSELKKIAKDADSFLREHHSLVHGKVSLNDLVVAAVALAFNELFDKEARDVTSAIWVGLNRKSVIQRPEKRENDWGNQNLGVSYLALPTGESDPVKVLLKAHGRLHAMKNSPEPLVANKLLRLIGSLPFNLLWPIRHFLLDKISTSISNFPGPIHPIKFPVAPPDNCNHDDQSHVEGISVIRDVFYLVAPPMSFGPYVTIISYNGNMYLSIAVQKKLISQNVVTEIVRDKIPAAFAKLNTAFQPQRAHVIQHIHRPATY